jgi:hypothetical protein
MLIKQIVIILLSGTLLSCAGSNTASDTRDLDGGSGRTDCIFESSIRGYRVLDEANLIFDVSGRRKYHVALQRRALGLSASWAIGFDSPSGRICAGFSDVLFKDQMGNESIRIQSIRALSPEDHEDLLILFGKMKPPIEQAPAPREVKGAEVEELDPDANDKLSGD